jgi:drug/metabolite transporter, DME family
MRVFMPACPASRRRPGTGLLYLVMSGLLWGTGGLTGSLLNRTAGLSSISVAAYRLTVGGVLILAFLGMTGPRMTGRRWPSGRAAWTRITAIGLLAAFYQSCYFTSVSLTSVPLATLVTIGTAPVIVLGVERVTGRGTGRLAIAAAGLALIGLGLLVGLPSGYGETAVLASAGMAVLAAAGFATITLTASRPVPGLDDLTVTGFGFTIGGLALMPLAATLGGVSFRPGPSAIGLLIALGTGPTAVAYTLYFRGLRTAAASTAALLSLLEPLTGTVLASVILGERLSVTGIVGAVILATAVILTVRGAGHVGGDDSADAQPGAPRQRLAEDDQAYDRGQDRVGTHEDPEVVGRNPAQREQVDHQGHRRGQDPRGGRARQRGDGRRMPDQYHDADGHEDKRGQARGRRRALRAGQPSPDQPVEQDVAGPARGR